MPGHGCRSGCFTKCARAGGPPIPVEEAWSDFQEIAGVKVPHRITVMQGGQKYAEVKMTDFKVNSGIQLEEICRNGHELDELCAARRYLTCWPVRG